jgi:hypothetical protein
VDADDSIASAGRPSVNNLSRQHYCISPTACGPCHHAQSPVACLPCLPRACERVPPADAMPSAARNDLVVPGGLAENSYLLGDEEDACPPGFRRAAQPPDFDMFFSAAHGEVLVSRTMWLAWLLLLQSASGFVLERYDAHSPLQPVDLASQSIAC